MVKDLRKFCYCLFLTADELDSDKTAYQLRSGKSKRSITWKFPSGVVLRLETPPESPLIPLTLHTAAQESGKALAKDFPFEFEVAQGGTGGPDPG